MLEAPSCFKESSSLAHYIFKHSFLIEFNIFTTTKSPKFPYT